MTYTMATLFTLTHYSKKGNTGRGLKLEVCPCIQWHQKLSWDLLTTTRHESNCAASLVCGHVCILKADANISVSPTTGLTKEQITAMVHHGFQAFILASDKKSVFIHHCREECTGTVSAKSIGIKCLGKGASYTSRGHACTLDVQ